MPRESHQDKGRRYVGEARLTVTKVVGREVKAVCRGAGAFYQLGHMPGRGWWCECPARTRCAHVYALQLVTVDRERNTA